MIRLSLMERLETMLNIIKNSNETKYIIPIIIVVSLLLIGVCLVKKRFVKYISVFLYIIGLGVLCYFYYEPILEILDYLVENIISNILFPNLAVYGFILLVINIIMIRSILSNKVKKTTKCFNIICFSIMQLSLFFIVKVIIENEINVYEKLNFYTNQSLLVLIEFSMAVFVIWMVLLMVSKLINKIINVVEKRKVNFTFTTLVCNNYKKAIVNPNQMVLNYELDDNMELVEFVPIKKKVSVSK